jgi:site-specific DNA recombinase
MRAATYARFSSERQNETSITDQQRLARELCVRLDLTLAAEYSDEAISASTPVGARPGGKRLLEGALAGLYQVLVLEGLDRLSREIGEQERIVKRLEHRGIRIIGLADAYDSQASGKKVLRLARGLVNELYIDDLRHKVHRGQEGAILRGFHPGGLSYGYRTVEAQGGRRLEIHTGQAAVVVRIFELYRDGASPQRIAHQLNRDLVAGPRGGTWCTSAIYGSAKKALGILNNTLYVGQVVWNRSQWIKDPDTGRRQRVDRPRSEWREVDEPRLRIVSDELWQAARRRLTPTTRMDMRGGVPTTLFGGLLRCQHCGGAVVAVDSLSYGCAAHKDRGTCAGVRAPRKALDVRLLAAVRDDVFDAAAIAQVRRQVRQLLEHAEREATVATRGAAARVGELKHEIERLVDAVVRVGTSDALTERLRRAESELRVLKNHVPIAVRANNNAVRVRDAEIDAAFKRLEMRLQEHLHGNVARARTILAELLGPVTVEARGAEVWASASINPARLLVAAGGGSKMDLVAGEGFEPSTFGL